MNVEPGRLITTHCPQCGGLERRAFGEIESPRGELASYAFGWTAGGADEGEEVAHMTIGIGAGNEGGGSFHIAIRMIEDDWAMMLVDEPFEDVPEGGPDLSREEALAHGDLAFVWHVADNVMAHDRRARWMEHWLRGTAAYVTQPVFDRTEPVRSVLHDEEGDWQLLCGTPGGEEEARLVHLHHALEHDQTLLDVLDLEPGERADRDGPGAAWRRSAA